LLFLPRSLLRQYEEEEEEEEIFSQPEGISVFITAGM
jgi:hypothetical protein